MTLYSQFLPRIVHETPAATPYAPAIAALNDSGRAHRTEAVRLRAAEAIRLALAGAAALLCLATAAVAETPSRNYAPLRAAVLGFRLEVREETDAADATEAATSSPSRSYRLVELGPPLRLVAEGDLSTCEERFLEELKRAHGNGNPNVPFITAGGKQTWADQFVFSGWRIQENVYTGHHRLLNPDDVRKAWGSYKGCRVAFEEIRIREKLSRRSDHLVVLLHGMFRSKDSFRKLERHLQVAGYEVANIAYPSTRRKIREHSEQISGVLDRSEGVRSVSFVTHSLGGIVARDLLSRNADWRNRIRVRRLVMLAPPNKGSIAAETMRDWFAFRAIAGKVGQQLTPEAVAQIPKPDCQFGVIAGGKGTKEGYNPLIPGDDDGVVSVANTRLEGARDFMVARSGHTFIMDQSEVIQAVLRFLKTGRFQAPKRD